MPLTRSHHFPPIHHHLRSATSKRGRKLPLADSHHLPPIHHHLRSHASKRRRKALFPPVKQEHMAFLLRHPRRCLQRRQNYLTSSTVHGSFRRVCHGKCSVLLLHSICTAPLLHLILILFHGRQSQLGLEPTLEMTLGTNKWSHTSASCCPTQFPISILS